VIPPEGAVMAAESTAPPSPVLQEAETFLRALTGGADVPTTFQTFVDSEELKNDKQASMRLARIFHGTLEGCRSALLDLNSRGAGVFVMVNEGDGTGRTARNVRALRALFAEDDHGELTLDQLPLKPSIVVQSRHGLHVYWLLRPGEAVARFKVAQKVIAEALGTDPSVNDLPRVMRLPGFLHRKDVNAPFLVRVVQLSAVTYPIAEVLDAITPALKTKRACTAIASATTGHRNTTLNREAFRLGVDAIKGTVPPDEAKEAARTAAIKTDLPQDEIERTIEHAFSDAASKARASTLELIHGKCGPRAVLANIIRVLEQPGWDGCIGFDELSLRPMLLKATPAHIERGVVGSFPRPWQDHDDAIVVPHLQEHYQLFVRPNQMPEAVIAVAKRHSFHRARDYLAGLRSDGKARLDRLLVDYFGAEDTRLNRAFGSKFLISAVARVLRPGVKADHMLILEGEQGSMKSTGLETLLPTPDLFTDDLGDGLGKDAAKRIQGKWLVEVAELDALGRAEVTRIKSFISRTTDRFRPAYGRWAQDARRQCVFAGTTNADVYLKDETGGRRFWPVRVGAIDLQALKRDRDRLWAEPAVRFERGEKWWLDEPNLVADAQHEQRSRYQEDPWHDRIAEFVNGREEVTLSQVLEAVGVELPRQGQSEQNRAAKTLKALGWRKTQVRRGEERPRVYRPSPVSPVTTPYLKIHGEKKDDREDETSGSGSRSGIGVVSRDSGDGSEPA